MQRSCGGNVRGGPCGHRGEGEGENGRRWEEMDMEVKSVWGGVKGHQIMEAVASCGKNFGFFPEHEAENPGRVKHQTTHPLPAFLSPHPVLGLYHLSPETFGSAVDATGAPHSNPLYQASEAVPSSWVYWSLMPTASPFFREEATGAAVSRDACEVTPSPRQTPRWPTASDRRSPSHLQGGPLCGAIHSPELPMGTG